MGRPKFALTEKCLNHHGAMVWLVAIESSVLHLRMPDLFAVIYKGGGVSQDPIFILRYKWTPIYSLTTTKSTCGCKDDKDECDTEKNPVGDWAALQCFQQIIWFTLEKFNLSFDHFESFGSGSTSFLWKFSLTAFPSRSGSSVGSWSIPCIKFQGSPLPFFKANWQSVEDCINFTFFARLGSSCQKDWLSLLF